ncbi:MAG: PLP-dependent cysteine synthase family protein [Planctomycetes bacterium]|nr:PLP-dependent cysteine synthase family protein [Planctomycetota bacterium]
MTTKTDILSELIHRVPALGLIGNTPLLEVNVLEPRFPALSIKAKAEWVNPGGSIKDRAVFRMLARVLEEGALQGRRILDSTSGNSGIAYAMIGAALGIPVTLVVPGNASKERQRRIKAHGAELILTDPILGYDEAMRQAHELADLYPDKYLLVDQYANEANWQAHYHGTAEELLRQTGGELTHFIAGVGTGGTLTGIAKRLKEYDPNITIVQAMPDDFPGIEGLKPLRAPDAIRPRIFDEALVDQVVDVTIDEAADHCHLLARNGIFVGQSSGANLAVAAKVAERSPNAKIVTIFADTGERYYSTSLWD